MTVFGATYFSAGQRLSAADLQALCTQIDSLTVPGWTSYGTFATLITAATTNPTAGNSTATAIYRRSADSDICFYEINFAVDTGGGFNAGSGAYRFQLPFTASTAEQGAHHMTINESGVSLRSGGTNYVNTTHVEGWYAGAGASIGSGGLSTSWTTGDWVKVSGFFRVAV